MRRWIVGLSLAACLWPAMAGAEQIYVRNHPFRGPVRGSGDRTQVGLEAMARELGLVLTRTNGGWVVGPSSQVREAQSGKVLVEGTLIDSQPGSNGEAMVPLQAFTQALGARVNRNPSLDTIDVYLSTPTARGSAPSGGPSGQVVSINQPGQVVDVAAHAVPGKVTIVEFRAAW